MPKSTPEEQREYQRKWVANRRQEWIDANGPCSCGSWDDLEVDHVDPNEKEYHVSQGIWSLAKNNPKRIAELSKCQVLCVKCHDEKTASDLRSRVTHGGHTMYETVGCRCPECREWKSIKNAKRKRL